MTAAVAAEGGVALRVPRRGCVRRVRRALCRVLLYVLAAVVLVVAWAAVRPYSVGWVAQQINALRLLPVPASLDAGVYGRATVHVDAYGVPHIEASSLASAFYAQGYMVARDRGFSIDLIMRLAAGRMSELVGEAAIELDRLSRSLGFYAIAQRDVLLASEDDTRVLDAYVAGINSYVGAPSSPWPIEYYILRGAPRNFTAVDVLAAYRFISWQMSGGWDAEILRGQLLREFGPEMLHSLYPNFNSEGPVHLPDVDFTSMFERTELHALDTSLGDAFATVLGSNAWALSGKRTKSGRVIVANDPHLLLTQPSTFYLVHVRVPSEDIEFAGATAAPIPGIVLGTNGRVSWGVTLSYVDVMDLRLVPFVNSTHWRGCDGKPVAALITQEEIRVRGGASVMHTVVRTPYGPILDMPDRAGLPTSAGTLSNLHVALQTTLETPTNVFAFVRATIRARNVHEMQLAAQILEAPSLNIVMGDAEGNIGYRTTGTIPARVKGEEGDLPRLACDNDWRGVLPRAQNPSVVNPESGFVVSANHPIVPDDRDGSSGLGKFFLVPTRADRIVELLSASTQWTPTETFRMQFDTKSVVSRKLAPKLCDRLRNAAAWTSSPTAAERAVVELVCSWDADAHAESAGAAAFQVLRHHLAATVLGRVFSGQTLDRVWGLGAFRTLKRSHERQSTWSSVVRALVDDPTFGNWLSRANLTEAQWLRESVGAATTELVQLLGEDPAKWTWGDLHLGEVAHALRIVPGLRYLMEPPPLRFGGDADSITATSFTRFLNGHYHTGVFWCVSSRYISAFDDSSAVSFWGALMGGQSGVPGSPHLSDGMLAMENEHRLPRILPERSEGGAADLRW